MRSHGLHGSNYIVLHVRVSEEKSRERGKQMPNLDVYPKAAASALLKANVSRVFLQACAHGVCMVMEMACVRGVRVACASRVHGISTCTAFTHAHAHARAHADGDAERGGAPRGLESEVARAPLVHGQRARAARPVDAARRQRERLHREHLDQAQVLPHAGACMA